MASQGARNVFVRRGRKVYIRTAPGGPEPITDEPTPPPVPPVPTPPNPAPTPPPTPDAPKPFDPNSLPAEAKAYLLAETKRIATAEGGKARETARQTEREATLAKIAEALGIKPAEVDPAQVAQQLTEARAEARALKVDRAVDIAARSAGADAEIVGALLEKAGKLKGLDPGADDFAATIGTLVADLVKSNPRVLLETIPAPGGQAPVNDGFNGQPTAGQWPSMLAAVQQRLGR